MANIIFLGCSSLFSSFIGTTGASILFLPSFLEMNKNRLHKWHLVIFFIFLVANIGGMLTPLGDAPLLMGYLHGVDFSWPLVNLFPYWLIYIVCCLCMLYAIDRIMLKKEYSLHFLTKQKFSIKVSGGGNIILLMLTIFVLFINFKHELFVPQIFIKSAILLLFSGISIYFRKGKHINFAPCIEVAQTFLAIFIVIAPVLFILTENTESIRNYIERMSHGSTSIPLYFWIGGIASSFLDNAPSYLLLFNIVGGNAESLMRIHSNILTAISVSTVVMGAMTYIGNAPNLMIRSIVQRNDIKMPSFIGYMVFSCLIILPISFIVVFLIS
jgi:Na+/H+ antiporter NhaD/arsenite permease-like protein